MYNVLMIGNTASVGWNFCIGLRRLGFNVKLFVSKYEDNVTVSGEYDYVFSNYFDVLTVDSTMKGCFDIVHIHYPTIPKIILGKRFVKKNGRIIIHFHGTDIRRLGRYSLLKYLINKYGDLFLYSTFDLRWFVLTVFHRSLAFHIRNPINMSEFYPESKIKKCGTGVFVGGSKALNFKNKVKHSDMCLLMNSYEKIRVIPADNIDSSIINVTVLEAVACGVPVELHGHLDRDWVCNNASIESQTIKLVNIYRELFNGD